MSDIPADNNGYLEISTRIIFRSAQQGSRYCKMKGLQRVMNMLHTDGPGVGIREELKSMWVVNAAMYLLINYCFNFFLGPKLSSLITCGFE